MFGLLRCSILLGAVLGIMRHHGKKTRRRLRFVRMLILIVAVATWEVTVVKLLVLARFTTDFRLPWFWSMFAWNNFAPLVFYITWNKLGDMKTARTAKNTWVQISYLLLINGDLRFNGACQAWPIHWSVCVTSNLHSKLEVSTPYRSIDFCIFVFVAVHRG